MKFKKGGVPWNKGTKGICRPNSGSFKKGQTPWNKDTKGVMPSGSSNPAWKGEETGYVPKHSWVRREYGNPAECEHCEATVEERKIVWSNKDHKYNRKREDWQQLCYSCHELYDIEHNNKYNN